MAEFEDEIGYAADLKDKPVCRFCLNQDEALSNIYALKSSNSNSQASLSMQIMACSGIEVFADDEMPSTICFPCRLLMDFCYRFKQMCKKSDTLLRQYQFTGVWPKKKLDHPKFPVKLIQNNQQTIKTEAAEQVLKRKQTPTTIMAISSSSPPSKRVKKMQQLSNDPISIEDMVVEFADEPATLMEEAQPIEQPQRILNVAQAPMKILNKQASVKSIEPVMRPPVLKTSEDGKIEVVSEILETTEDGDLLDPIKNAAPVETNVFPCNYCERSFPLRQLLDIHVANHVRDRKFQCEVCQKGFFSKYDLGKHELIHTGEKPFSCVVCGKAFSRSTLLRRHEKMHSDQPKFLCAYCERPFLSKEEWERHTQNHQKKRPFSCEYCGKSFAFKQGLERHEIVHSIDQPFKCEHCDMGFSTQGKLARHLTAHAGDRPYPCRICDKSYLLSHHLTRHMRSHKEQGQGGQNTEFRCEFCDLVFANEADLHEHSDSQHLDEIEMYERMSNAEEHNFTTESIEFDNALVKPEREEMIEYADEQVELITPDDEESMLEHAEESPPPQKSYAGKANSKLNKKSPTAAEPAEKSPKTGVVRSPNTRASAATTITSNNNSTTTKSTSASPEKLISTRSSKGSPNKPTPTVETTKTVPAAVKKLTQTTLSKSITIKSTKVNGEQSSSGTPTLKKLIPLVTTPPKPDGTKATSSGGATTPNKLVKVKQIKMTKAQIEAWKKQGKIEMRGNHVILKK